jgi:dolichol-phosphate mannosyltransferase
MTPAPADSVDAPHLPPTVAVVVAVLNEAENIAAVASEIAAAFAAHPAYEVVFVDDGSTDGTAAAIRALAAADPRIRLVRHAARCGKSAAIRTGVAATRACWIATMDGDRQNDPRDLVAMLRAAEAAGEPSPLVAGIRVRRQDPLPRRIATKVGNGIRRALLQDDCPDTACGMKVFRRDAFLALPCFEGMHRFLPALFRRAGAPLINHPVAHRPRAAGRSKYTNINRALVGVPDLFGVMWLRSRMRTPVIRDDDA